jgi:PKD repeat protein
MKQVLFSISIFISLNSFSQFLPCKTPEMNQWAEVNNPEAIQAKKTLEDFTQKYISNGIKDDTLIIIPVVFHVVHNYGAENISKEQILDAIRILNEDYRKLNADTSDIIPEFKAIAADSRIEFRLAKIDPNGNCTDGIDRVVSTLTYNADENTKMIAPSWDRTKYLNIWTVASIANGAAGYSYYPSSVNGQWGENIDGVLILSSYVGSIGTGGYTTSRALTHEIGHYLNLMHPWGNSNTPGLADNCNDDDQVSDTPNTIGHTSCNLYSVTCGSLDNVQNYMDYAYCDRMYTEGQKLRMRAALNSSISGRNNLWTEQNLVQTGVSSNTTPPICEPIVDFSFNKNQSCPPLTVQYTNLTWHTDSISLYTWIFEGGTPSISHDTNPIVTYYNTGLYSSSLIATNPANSDTIVKTDIIRLLNSNVAFNLPWNEGFENADFPYLQDTNLLWVINGNGNNFWYKTNEASASGLYSLKAPNNLNNYNETTTFYTSNIFSNSQNPEAYIKFKVAYAQLDSTSDDFLEIYISANCGASWFKRYDRRGHALQTVNGTYYNDFVPENNQWRQDSIGLGSYATKPTICLKFVSTSRNGNPIYIDDIQLDQASEININSFDTEYLPSIFPNPIDESSRLWLKTNKEENLTIKINNIVGQCLINKNIDLINGENSLQIPEFNQLSSGIYFVSLYINDKSTNIKVIIP